MGIVPLSLDFLYRYLPVVGGLQNCHMMELGDQQMYCHHNIPEGSAAKSWFERMGAKHTSIDTNGQLGAIALDLSVPINRPEWDGQFDVVTDFGTSEHVGTTIEALYNCRANCHRWCRQGGLLYFMNPKTGHWPKHGFHYFTMAHYHKLAEACGYLVLEISENPSLGNYRDGWQVHAAFQKMTSTPFISLEKFSEIYANTVFAA
jgi:hypothetical protein